jgi:amino acid adenylation domain-containing protein/non-ribosomal peptide synthase protein (TIGR01720 family)
MSYWAPRISDWQANNVASTFTKVFRSLLDETGNGTLAEMHYFSDRDMNQVLEWNSTQPKKIDACVHDVFAKQVSVQPHKQAICSWDGDFTYEELDDLSTRLAHHLAGFGVGPEVIVPLCFEKSAWTIVAMLAVLKAGGACVSLDPSHPMARLEGIVRDVGRSLILIATELRDRFSGFVQNVLVIDQSYLNQLPTGGPLITSVQSSNTAFVIYTSGSTGKPKGVVLEHTSLCTSIEAHGAALQITPKSRVLQFAAYVFDISLQDIFTTLLRGGCVCVPSENERVDDLPGAINKMEVNWACITPTVASILQPSDVPTLKTLTLAGEAVTKKVTDTWIGFLKSFNNCYGPAESTIYCAWNGIVGKTRMPSNIGRGLASLLWVVEPADHDRLSPVGCIGELLVEGPLLARGYLNDPNKTIENFIEDPVWTVKMPGSRRRMYKTGDLVRQNSDGTLDYLGRKDTQVKLRGQRLELGEVEYHLTADDGIGNAMAIVPMQGHCQNRLVALITLRELSTAMKSRVEPISETTSGNDLQLVMEGQKEAAVLHVSRLRKLLSNYLPTYMVPSVWIVVETIPLNTSSKLDRAKAARWVQDIDLETYHEIIDAKEAEQIEGPTTTMGRRLQRVIGRVLNLTAEQVSLSRSFLSLGGDSITAMQTVSRARSEGITVKVQDVLQARSILELALVAKTSNQSLVSRTDEIDVVFKLSPVQQMYFQIGRQQVNQFNQSFFLRFTREIQAQDVALAVEAVVRQHSMLRARFTRLEDEGQWGQFITKDITQAYQFRLHEITRPEQITTIMAASQASLDVEKGLVFIADMFNAEGSGQLLFLVAHHLVIDQVSWRIVLQDLEEILESGSLSAETPFPFQAWCKSQMKHAQQKLMPKEVLPYEVTLADYAYWGMADQPNLYGDAVSQSFVIDADTTSKFLGSCQQTLGTEPVDIFIATLLYSFSQTFDRATPTVFSEGHGREPWNDEIDLSGTVGWFTTMSPLHMPIAINIDVIEVVRRIKDTRRKLPGSGWPYFASRFLNMEGIKEFQDHLPMEVLFNYLGRYQQLERQDVLLQQEPMPAGASDVGLDVPRLALFEISVVVIHGLMRFNVVYNRCMQRQTEVVQWIRAWEQSLKEATTRLSTMKVERTLSDFHLLSLTDATFQKLKDETLSLVGVTSLTDVEDVYPCSPMQQGLLLSQTREPGAYDIAFTFEVVVSDSSLVNVEKLLSSWQHVVDRHPALRTVFIDSVSEEGIYDQVVLKKVIARTTSKQCIGSDIEALTTLKELQRIDHKASQPPHQFTVCQTTPGKVFFKLEINHAIIDATSILLLQRDLALAYDGSLSTGSGPLYSKYIKYLGDRPHNLALEFWRERLAGIESCNFPLRGTADNEPRQLKHIPINLDLPSGALRDYCETNGVTVPNLVQTVWGLVLRSFCNADQVCFGYLSSGRDAPVEGINEAVGPFINMLVTRVDAAGTAGVTQLVKQVQEGYLAGLDHQHCSLAEIQHGLNLGGTSLFNTVMSVQRSSESAVNGGGGDNVKVPTISFKSLTSHDPTEVSDINIYECYILTETTVRYFNQCTGIEYRSRCVLQLLGPRYFRMASEQCS